MVSFASRMGRLGWAWAVVVGLGACGPAGADDDGSTNTNDATDTAANGDGNPHDRGDSGADTIGDAGDGADGDGGDAAGDPGGDDSPVLDVPEPLEGTQASRALGFALYYRERTQRMLLATNRFLLGGDVNFASLIGGPMLEKTGNQWTLAFGPTDNNDFGLSTFDTLMAYRKLGGRQLELTLIRQLNALTFMEAVSGHPGLTTREALPGWTLAIDGVAKTTSRARGGASVALPSGAAPITVSQTLEAELVRTFFDGVYFTYRNDPREAEFSIHPLVKLDEYALTFVFAGLPRFLRISDCCSSWIVSEKGPWAGALWANHNSRDNFPDLAIGYLAAQDLADDPNLPADLRTAAQEAAAAGRRVGDAIVAANHTLQTVPETGSYDALIAGGAVRPDGRDDGPLGTLNYCQGAYLAQAMSSAGLSMPVPHITLPPNEAAAGGAGDVLQLLGLGGSSSAPQQCETLDDSPFGSTWREFIDKEFLGMPWHEFALELVPSNLDTFRNGFSNWADSMYQLELTTVALCEYARSSGKADLYAAARASLANQIELHHIFVNFGMAVYEEDHDASILERAKRHLYYAALRARMYGIPVPDADLAGFTVAETRNQGVEALLALTDSTPLPLMSDAEIAQRVEAELAGLGDEPQVADRYRARFGSGATHAPPLKRSGDAYQAIDVQGAWKPLANHGFRRLAKHEPFFEIPMCSHAPDTVSCSWARLGCARPDLDHTGTVDAADAALLIGARTLYAGQTCRSANTWCGGADLDHSGVLDGEDDAFMVAAQGCRTAVP